MLLTSLTLWAALLTFAPQADPDTDGDGLPDIQEKHKYFTNPHVADSDGDGVADSDWNERREFTYTLRTVVQVLPPVTPDALNDDYQDARILDDAGRYIELEVVHYPLNTVAQAIVFDADWRQTVKPMVEWTRPGLTSNWDQPMRDCLIAALKEAGIDALTLDDMTLVEKASRWVLEHARYEDGFSTFCSQFVDGQPRVFPGMEESARSGQASSNMTIEQQWERELFARGMFEHAVRGSCTSSAIYMNGCLRALGIPTRIVLCISVIDSSDEREVSMLDRISNHRVRSIVQDGAGSLGNSWSSHTFNEVFVGGRWRRLNYDRLGQNTLDPQFFGLMTHVATFSDWADGNMAATWGMRQAHHESDPDDPFGGSNPYSCISLSDRFGAHAKIENARAAAEFTALTIDRLQWFAEHPAGVDMRLDDPATAGHLVVRVVEGQPGEGPRQYKRFYERVGKEFVLKAANHPDVPLHATRGYWAKPEDGVQHFYLRIEPIAFRSMAADVPYQLVALNGPGDHQWIVKDDVTITRSAADVAAVAQALEREGANGGRGPDVAAGGVPAAARAAPADVTAPAEIVDGVPTVVTVDFVTWSDAPDSPTGPLPDMQQPVLLARMGSAADFDAIKAFTERSDMRFFLEADGHPTLKIGAAIGGVTTGEHSYAIISLGPADWNDLEEGVEYTLRPQNSRPPYRWLMPQPLRVRR